MTPLVQRDIAEQLRHPRTYLLLAASALLAGAAVGMEWPPEGVLPFESNLATRLFARLAQAQYILLLVVAPALAGATIVAEREHGTLPLLTATLISPGQIIASRIATTLCVVGLLAGVILPFLALPLLLGTARLGWLVSHIAAAASLAFYLVAAGVFASARSRRTRVAIPLAYILGWTGTYALAGLGLFEQEHLTEETGTPFLGRLVPGMPHVTSAPVAAVLTLASGLGGARFAARALARPLPPAARWRRRRTAAPERRAGFDEAASPPSDAPRAASGRAVGRHVNPVLSAELRTRLLGRRSAILAIGCGAALLAQAFLLLLTLRLEWFVDADRWVVTAICIHITIAWACCSALAAIAIPIERERRTLPLLLASLLSPRQIVLGKWLGVLWYGQIFLLSALPLLAMAVLTGTLTAATAARLAMICAGTIFLATGAGMALCASARRSTQALGRVLGLTSAMVLIGPLVARLPGGSTAARGASLLTAPLAPWSLAARAAAQAGPSFDWWGTAEACARQPSATAEPAFLVLAAGASLAGIVLATRRLGGAGRPRG